ncbi:hypothetical protein WICMUC_004075 [Wickerhamomyces mucosus]|uniref:Reverse transcriptase domain-containing protein n=1 Tax=Wickerhamomyces mucosus TaxID=1378264 RepID=A0A9P8PIC2_9ASCO|nr:hypothetical protein WICMUC_004075 [Wickerhamomyces mucosus]
MKTNSLEEKFYVPKTFIFNNQLLKIEWFTDAVKEIKFFSKPKDQVLTAFQNYDKNIPIMIEEIQDLQNIYMNFKFRTDEGFDHQQFRANESPRSFISNKKEGNNIMNEAYQSFSELYQPNLDICEENIHVFLKDYQSKITSTEFQNLNEVLTIEELEDSLKYLSKKKTSPGPDGITYQLIKLCWKEFAPLLQKVAIEMAETGNLPIRMKKVYIQLLPKKNFKKNQIIDNLRPIALNCCTLKIIGHSFKKRLLNVANRIIDPYQLGSLKNRPMKHLDLKYTQYLYASKLSTTSTQNDDAAAAMYMVDFQKAFDSISHKYILTIFRYMGFPKSFINILKSMISEQVAQLKIGSLLSNDFKLHSGVRQGNPISLTIFNLAIEPLLQSLKAKLQGLHIPTTETITSNITNDICFDSQKIKILCYSRDLSIILTNENETEIANTLLTNFSKVSGMKFNKQKSNILHFTFSNSGNAEDIIQEYETISNSNKMISSNELQVYPLTIQKGQTGGARSDGQKRKAKKNLKPPTRIL